MAKRTKEYKNVKFPYGIIASAYNEFRNFLNSEKRTPYSDLWLIEDADHSWELDYEDQFIMAYQKDVSSAAIIHKHYLQGEDFDDFIVRFRHSDTEVSISLPSISNIETIFNIFDSNYEKYINVESISKPHKKSETEIIIPSTIVEKKLLESLEEYIKSKALEIDSNLSNNEIFKPELVYRTPEDTHKISSIKDFDRIYFPDRTRSITLHYGGFRSVLFVNLVFSLDRSLSKT